MGSWLIVARAGFFSKLLVVLEGEAEILVGAESVRLGRGGITFAPRWIVHQSHNVSAERELLLLAITDFGLTSSVLGDYDCQTRLRFGGKDACHEVEFEPESGSNPADAPREALLTKSCTCRGR